MAIKDRLKLLRARQDMTLEEVAKAVGVTRATIQKYENGIISNIPSDKIEALARVLRTTPAYLMGWDTDTNSTTEKDTLKPQKTRQYITLEKVEKINNPSTNDDEESLLNLYRELNQEGKEKLYGYADDLVSSGKYIKTDTDRMVQGEK